MEQYLWLVPLGLVLGAVGTLIGAGGGFVLVPVLLLLYPSASPITITSISLAVVFFNALSGSLAYARMGRVDYRSGLLFAAATVPGAVIGVLTTDFIPRRLFNAVFGLLMIVAAAYLFFQRNAESKAPGEMDPRHITRNVVETTGIVHAFSYDLRIGMWLSLFVGYVSSLLGIGGGIIHVPALARLLNFPVHIATATSHFVLSIMALTGTIVHIVTGSFSQGGVRRTIALALGVVIGAQVGAALSSRIHGRWIIRGLTIALAFVGIRIIMMALSP
ncbi:MAG TPA: sulfite exporter TauE/SafE family protein [Candidatus Eisenbacteria bacterium]|uniref:Probable membrane transporter protein n=1 Tax=Eiseniibacteriota bacterium TaxID=2212470 RepID=A0A7V2F422_UNCEI|nr:sulfite exporter TauE/SafE family protein [Candidatus Eisenbacteria bacterium]